MKKKLMDVLLKRIGNNSQLQGIYLLWPNMRLLNERYCEFVSPLMPAKNGQPLAEYAIGLAIDEYCREPSQNRKPSVYINKLLEVTAEAFNGVQILGIHNEYVLTWEPFLEPMTVWMQKNNINTIRTAPSGNTNTPSVAKLSLLAHIATAYEIKSMELVAECFAS